MKLHLLAGVSLASVAVVFAAGSAQADTAAAAVSAAIAGEVVHGRVVNGAGEPLPGAEVRVRGSAQRAVTDTQGEFNLILPTGQAMLDAVSYTHLTLPTKRIV